MILAARLKERLSTSSSPKEKKEAVLLRGDENSSGFEVCHELEEIQAQISGAVRREAIEEIRRIIRSRQGVLRTIWLGPARPADIEQAWRDLVREPCISLNGVFFCGDQSIFPETFQALIDSLSKTRHDTAIMKALVARMARTSAGADSYFFVQWLLGLDRADTEKSFIVIPAKADISTNEKPLEVAIRPGPTENTLAVRLACRNAYLVRNIENASNDNALQLLTTVLEDLLLDYQGTIIQDDRFLALGLKEDLPSSMISLLPTAHNDDFSSFYEDTSAGLYSPFSPLTSMVKQYSSSIDASPRVHHYKNMNHEHMVTEHNAFSTKKEKKAAESALLSLSGGTFLDPQSTHPPPSSDLPIHHSSRKYDAFPLYRRKS